MAIERSLSREVQNQQSDQTGRDASASKTCDFWRRQCQRNDNQQQSKGKELALPKGKDPFNGVAIGEDGKPVEKQIILSERYDKDHQGLPGAGRGGKAVKFIVTMMLDNAIYLGYDQLVEMIRGDAVEEKLDRMIRSRFETGAELLEDAKRIKDPELKRQRFAEAAKKFISASKVENDGFMQAKAMFYTGVCYHLLGEQDAAMKWHQKAYDKTYNLGEEAVKTIEDLRTEQEPLLHSDSYILSGANNMNQNRQNELMGQLQEIREFLEPIKELIEKSPSTSDNPRRDLQSLRNPREGHELVKPNSDSCAIQ
jgi:tetratricopeptide (TPR) repeat protein